MNLTDEQIAAAAAKVLAPFEPAAVYLYGSFAQGRARPDSDVDVALLARAPVDRRELADAAVALGERLGRDVDLVDLYRVGAVLRVQVISRGRLLLEQNELLRHQFEMHALSSYAHLNESRREIMAEYGR